MHLRNVFNKYMPFPPFFHAKQYNPIIHLFMFQALRIIR